MKIRPSLRLYFFATMVLLSSLMAIGFSFLSVNYFIDGLDRGLNGVMHALSQSTEVKNGEPAEMIGFKIASRWEDMPSEIQQRFTKPTEIGVLQKSKVKPSFFSMPEDLYFVAYFQNPAGEPRYVSRIMLEKERLKKQSSPDKPIKKLAWIALTGVTAIALFTFFLFMVMKKIAKPVESLRGWAKSLNQKNLQNTPPDFTYNELNTLATLIRSSLLSAHDSLEREQRFLSYASHELRTPISVIRSNVELLNRLSEKAPLSDKQHLTLQRIERAGLTMSDLTETLLWLSRNDDQQSAPEPVNLAEKITTLSNELDYLLNSKQVDVLINTDNQNTTINTEATACHIVLTNLIRNAYQHTQQGQVRITQQDSRVIIVNSSAQTDTPHSANNTNKPANIGYGLGLELSEKIIKRHGWVYEVKDMPGRYEVVVDFS
ncbi:HAMP domain-containing sensor histidine kinase [Pseudoalteromonas sp. SG43-3]|uniref:sensor histidine kinase n=1 Tax=Pseudoalteromonas sp. SG43-3 TaxID=2760970 RepID=UPI0016017D81|nr:HAMP domain-containing sensor histidine kinase [Pseudoalteromonas sp. SG43-3]MBB1445157.1 HAMP domain-containing histidine kinase [Pseudoalteromonas sp. SG43-3]